MKKTLLLLMILSCICLTACQTNGMNRAFSEYKERYIKEWNMSAKDDDSLMQLELYHFAYYFKVALGARTVEDIPEEFLDAIAYLDRYATAGSSESGISNDAWLAVENLYSGDQFIYKECLLNAREIFEELKGEPMSSFLETHFEQDFTGGSVPESVTQ